MFDGARLKIKRAEKHIKELQGVLSAFLDSDFCVIAVEEQPGTRRYLVKIKHMKSFPCDIPAIIGDVIHNLRAALDLLMSEMITLAGETPEKSTYFPFAKTRDDLKGAIKGGQVKLVGSDIVDLIVDVIRPYESGGQVALYALNRLDISDKHRLLIPTAKPITLRGVSGRFGNVVMKDCSFGIREGGEMDMINMPPGPIYLEDKGKATFEVLFGEDQPLEGEPVVPTLKQLSQLVSGVVDAIEGAYLARGKSANA